MPVYPACAGIDLFPLSSLPSVHSLPRMRGDRPPLSCWGGSIWRFTPHARGSTRLFSRFSLFFGVYPACAGIDLASKTSYSFSACLPRMRGDRPTLAVASIATLAFTPHARGSPCEEWRLSLTTGVYPACAGIDPVLYDIHAPYARLPRMRGDRPQH